jgi:mutator family transposase
VTDRTEPFASRVRAGLAGRTAELERLAVEMFARGLSTRDIEAAFRNATGNSLLSRTAVSQVTERLWQEYPRPRSDPERRRRELELLDSDAHRARPERQPRRYGQRESDRDCDLVCGRY